MADLAKHRSTRPFGRKFLPENANLADWNEIEEFFKQLRDKPADTREELENWLDDLSELHSALSEEGSFRYINMTCHTDNPELEKAYLFYLEQIVPKCQPLYFELNKKYLASPARKELPRQRYNVFDRAVQTNVDIFRKENVALQTEDDVLAQQYQKICGEMTAEFGGKECTMPQLMRHLEETDRSTRHSAWSASVVRRMKDLEKIQSIFDKMIELRTKIARNAGFANYIEYQFKNLGRYDYTPEDCYDFHNAVEKCVVPVREKLRQKRKEQLKLAKLSPWDLDVDPEGRAPLRPFESAEQLIAGADKIFSAVSPSFSKDFAVLREGGLLDLDNRKGKAPGGYQSTLDEVRLPFIFMNATGRNQDVFTLLHEGGHAFHALAARDEKLYSYRSAPIEFCEVASMGMEMMSCERLKAFYDEESAKRAREQHLEEVIVLLPWIARVDAFQHWLYKNPEHTREERAKQWLELDKRFGENVEWPEHEKYRAASWTSKLHFFCVPLYYIEYGIAQLGALQLWKRFTENADSAVAGYRSALSLGGGRPLPELFSTAGLDFRFNESIIRPLTDKLEKEV